MKFFVLHLLAIFLCSSLWAEDSIKLLTTPEGKVELVKKESLWVSKDCAKTKCVALRTSFNKKSSPKKGWTGHPAAQFCEANEGKYLVGKYSDGSEDGLCLFKDKSSVLAWGLYYLHRDKK